MKHSGHIDINQSIEKVTEAFANPDNLKHYQDGFLRKEHKSGTPMQTGAKAMMYYQYGKGEMELEETITNNNLPHSFEASYYHKHMDNTMKCEFSEIGEGQTRYAYEYEYTRINWVMPKLMAILFPSMYRKPAEKWLRQFKEFVEKQ